MKDQPVFRHKILPYILVMPQLALALMWFIWPSVEALYQSFFRTDPLGIKSVFVGFTQYIKLFTDPYFLSTLRITLVYGVTVTFLPMAIGLLLAVMAERRIYGRQLFRTLLIIPYGIAPAIAAVLWRFLLEPRMGLIAKFLTDVGLQWDYRLNEAQALTLVILVGIWARISYSFIFYSAGLQGVPKALIEAAAIDGATRWKSFWAVVFPLLSPTTFFLFVVNSVYSLFETFGIIDALTQGGPAGATEILVYRVYRDGMINLNINQAAAQAVLLLVFSIIMTAIQFRLIERKVHYA